MMIYRALLNYGYDGFKLEILEYCSKEALIEREQFYIDSINPEYNILKVASSTLGFKHSEASKDIMSQLAQGRKFSPETLLKMKSRVVSDEVKKNISAALIGREVSSKTRDLTRKALLGRKLSEGLLKNMSLSNTWRQPVRLTSTETGEVLEFPSKTEAGKYLGTSCVQISRYLKKNLPCKGYTIHQEGDAKTRRSYPKTLKQSVLLTKVETGVTK
jgi:group I intron endonuclease